MASSKEVLAVLGNLCISRKFRKAFFENPQATAESLVGRLRPDEVEQILALAGAGKLPSGLTRETFLNRFQAALDQVYTAAECPTPPCPPDPDPDPPKA
jgi:hypothetical protein